MAITGMNHAVLYVRDARRSAAFYRDVLGFALIIDDPQGRFENDYLRRVLGPVSE